MNTESKLILSASSARSIRSRGSNCCTDAFQSSFSTSHPFISWVLDELLGWVFATRGFPEIPCPQTVRLLTARTHST